jgi:hypothetical protein
MKKYNILVLAILIVGVVIGQEVKRQTVKRITQADHNLEWYQTQKKLWKEEVVRNPKSEEAWRNYYEASRGELHKSAGNPHGTKSPAMKIVNEMEKNIPNTFTFYHCKANQSSGEKGYEKYLIKAYEKEPNNIITYENLIVYYEMNGKISKRQEIVNKLYEYGEVSVGFLNQSYNLLMTADKNGIIITAGDNDTYAMWVLQDVFKIRTDVIVVNRWMIKDSTYANVLIKRLGSKFTKSEKKRLIIDPKNFDSEIHKKHTSEFIKIISSKLERKVYLAQTAWLKGLYGLEDKFYNVGLAFQFSETDIDNIALAKRNYHKRYRLDYLLNSFYKESKSSIIKISDSNYAPGLILIYLHAKNSEDAQEMAWARQYLDKLVATSTKEMKKFINHYLNK